MTERLYYDNAYLTDFEARITQSRVEKGEHWVALDQSAFYPTSGGQPFDTGTLTWEGHTLAVTDVTVDDQGVVWHRVDGMLPPDAAVTGRIDWARRFDHMQQHAGEHILAGCLHQLFGGFTHGLHIGQAFNTIDVTMPEGVLRLTEAQMAEVEALANRRIQQDAPMRAWFPNEQEMAELPLRKDPTVDSHVRVVAAGDYEMVACGGTHPSSTGQIGLVKLLDTQPARGKMRVSFVCGMRALQHYQGIYENARQAGAMLSAPADLLAPAVERLQGEQAELRQRLQALQGQMADMQAEALLIKARPLEDGARLVTSYEQALDAEGLRTLAARLTRQPRVIALLAAPREQGCLLLFARSQELTHDMAALLRQAGGRGGGKPDFAQGSGADAGVLDRAANALGRPAAG
ncbi:MAG: hypothetical protein GX650_01550 [Clostridiales bacterium]|nr:hypothetical protein [Clostridiales bacterium]